MPSDKAMDLIRMAVAKATFLEPQQDIESSLVRKALVIGGGVAGLSAAGALADMGVDVVLVEKEPRTGRPSAADQPDSPPRGKGFRVSFRIWSSRYP